MITQYRTRKTPNQADHDLDVLLLLDLFDLDQVKTRAALGSEAILLHVWLHEAGVDVRTGGPGRSTGGLRFLLRCRFPR